MKIKTSIPNLKVIVSNVVAIFFNRVRKRRRKKEVNLYNEETHLKKIKLSVSRGRNLLKHLSKIPDKDSLPFSSFYLNIYFILFNFIINNIFSFKINSKLYLMKIHLIILFNKLSFKFIDTFWPFQ